MEQVEIQDWGKLATPRKPHRVPWQADLRLDLGTWLETLPPELQRFVELLAGGLNLEEIAREMGRGGSTLDRWRHLLRQSGQDYQDGHAPQPVRVRQPA